MNSLTFDNIFKKNFFCYLWIGPLFSWFSLNRCTQYSHSIGKIHLQLLIKTKILISNMNSLFHNIKYVYTVLLTITSWLKIYFMILSNIRECKRSTAVCCITLIGSNRLILVRLTRLYVIRSSHPLQHLLEGR